MSWQIFVLWESPGQELGVEYPLRALEQGSKGEQGLIRLVGCLLMLSSHRDLEYATMKV